jgi:hypothetical protein
LDLLKKKDLKNYFSAINAGNLQTVKDLVNSNPEYLTAANTSPPKKDDGQSGLQIAFKNGKFDISKRCFSF